jgi:hypothetical protein
MNNTSKTPAAALGCRRFAALVLGIKVNCSTRTLSNVVGPTAWHRFDGADGEARRRQTPEKTVAFRPNF